MSNTIIKGITVEIGGDTTQLNDALKSSNQTSRDLQSELKAVNQQLKFDPTNTTLLQQKQDLLAQSISNTKTKLDALRQAQEQVNKAHEANAEWEKEYAPLRDAIDATQKKLKTLTEQQETMEKDFASGKISAQKYENFQKTLQETTQTSKDLAAQERTLEAQFADGHISDEQYRNFQRQIVSAENELKSLEKQAGLTEASLNKISTVSGKVGEAMTSAGEKMMPATLAVVGLGAAATKMGSDFIESSNKADVAFGNSSDVVQKFSETSLKNFGIASGSALDMASTYGDMATSLGISQDKAATMSTTLVGLSGDLSSFKNIDLSQSSNALNSIFTGETESLKKLGIVMTDANLNAYAMANGYDKTTDKMSQAELVQLRYNYVLDATKNAQGDFVRTSDGAANSIRVASESAKEAGESFGVMLAPVIAKVAQYISSIVQGFAGLDSGTKQIILTIAGIIAVVAPALIIGGKIFTLISGITKAMSIMKTATFAEAYAQTSLNAALLASPITWIVIGIVALVAAFAILWVKCDAFRNFWIGLWNGIKAVTAAVVNAIVGFFTSLPQKIKEIFGHIVEFFKQWGPLILTAIAPAIGLPLLIIQHWSQISEFFQQLWGGIANFFASLPAKFGNLMSSIGNAVLNGIKAIGNFFMELPSRIMYGLGYALGSVIKWGVQLYVWATTDVPKIIARIIVFFEELPGKIANTLANLINQFNQWSQQIMLWAITQVAAIIASIGNFFAELPGRIWDALVNAYNQLNQWGQQAVNWVITQVPIIISNIITFFQELPGKLWNALVNAIVALNQWGQQVEDWLGQQLGEIGAKIVNFFAGLPAQLLDIGKNIVDGLWNGITGAWHKITDGVKNLTSDFIKGFKDALGVHSPSTIFADIGGFLSQGLANGIADKAGAVTSTLQSLAQGAAQTMTDNLLGSNGLQAAFSAATANISASIPTGFDSSVPARTAMNAANGVTQAATASGNSGQPGAAQQATAAPVFQQTVNNYSPKALSPAEAARQTRNATRKLVLALNKG